MAHCAASETQGGFGGSIAHAPRAGERTVVFVDLVTLDGQVRIDDVPLQASGFASDGFVLCARNVLRGQVIEVRTASAGSRMRVALPLGPRSEPSTVEPPAGDVPEGEPPRPDVQEDPARL